MLKLKIQSFGHLMLRTHSLEKTLILGKMNAGLLRTHSLEKTLMLGKMNAGQRMR